MPKETFKRLSEDKQNAFIEAFLEEFSQKQYEEASISQVVKSLGIAKGSVYQYFDGKLDLYLYLKELSEQTKMEYILHVRREAYPDFWAFFRDLYVEGIRFDLEHPKKSRFLHGIGRNERSPVLGDFLKEWMRKAREMMGKMIEVEVEAGRFRSDLPIKSMAHFLVSASTSIADYMEVIHGADFQENLRKGESLVASNAETLLRSVDEYIPLLKQAFAPPQND